MTRAAAGVPGLALANLTFTAPHGVRTYVDPPDIHDRVERGEVTGIRGDRVTYVFERAGRFAIPAVAQPWWNLQDGSPHTLTLPARVVEVAAGPAAPGISRASWTVVSGEIAAGLLLVATAVYLARGSLVAWRITRRNSATHSEQTAFRALRRACREADAATTYQAWRNWDVVRPDRTMPPDLAAEVAKLDRSLFGRGATWGAADAARLGRAASKARRQQRTPARESDLPPLNPARPRHLAR